MLSWAYRALVMVFVIALAADVAVAVAGDEGVVVVVVIFAVVVLPTSSSTACCRRRVAFQDEQLAVIPVLHEERDMLREALGEERVSREDDLHTKDGEIATLKAKVIHTQYMEIYGLQEHPGL